MGSIYRGWGLREGQQTDRIGRDLGSGLSVHDEHERRRQEGDDKRGPPVGGSGERGAGRVAVSTGPRAGVKQRAWLGWLGPAQFGGKKFF